MTTIARDPDFDRRVNLAGVAASGGWSLGVLLAFAGGHHRTAYTMLAVGTVIATSIALVRVAAAPSYEGAELEKPGP